jgi:hypothetical protein
VAVERVLGPDSGYGPVYPDAVGAWATVNPPHGDVETGPVSYPVTDSNGRGVTTVTVGRDVAAEPALTAVLDPVLTDRRRRRRVG